MYVYIYISISLNKYKHKEHGSVYVPVVLLNAKPFTASSSVPFSFFPPSIADRPTNGDFTGEPSSRSRFLARRLRGGLRRPPVTAFLRLQGRLARSPSLRRTARSSAGGNPNYGFSGRWDREARYLGRLLDERGQCRRWPWFGCAGGDLGVETGRWCLEGVECTPEWGPDRCMLARKRPRGRPELWNGWKIFVFISC